jgi:hypothetical protein
MPHVVNDRATSPMEADSERLPTKEEFDHWCQWKVARILEVLRANIVKYEAFKALSSGSEIPGWLKEILLEAFRPPPSNQLAKLRRHAPGDQGNGRRKGRRT